MTDKPAPSSRLMLFSVDPETGAPVVAPEWIRARFEDREDVFTPVFFQPPEDVDE